MLIEIAGFFNIYIPYLVLIEFMNGKTFFSGNIFCFGDLKWIGKKCILS